MRKKTEICRAIGYLSEHDADPLCRAQREVLEACMSENRVFERYVRGVPEAERNESLYYAARDAARFLAGKIGIGELCPGLDGASGAEDGGEEEEETVTLSRREYDSLLKRLERVERRLGLRVGTTGKAPRRDIAEAPSDLIAQADACKLIGCGKTTIKRWADKGLVIGYRKGRSVYYSRRALLASPVVKEHRESKQD